MAQSTAIRSTTQPEAFDAFYRREYRQVLGLAIVLCGEHAAGEDLAQEAFVAAMRGWSKVGSLDSPGAWVRRVVANRSVSRWRRFVAERRALQRLPARPNLGPQPELSAEAGEVWAAVRSLPKRQAQALALTYVEGLSVEEVAGVLGCSSSSVKTHLQRGRARLSRLLAVEEG